MGEYIEIESQGHSFVFRINGQASTGIFICVPFSFQSQHLHVAENYVLTIYS